ncbi:hypothetical protein [Salinarimonas soli]|uniref:Cation transporter n=1 Tax=Salinarimonas soli TaxID=1638099 RepID=A0A5B2VTZ9_9HYPH|nr:hypothetical protein [Salinarimonas soli]KAA2242078.1 hypothetical protein F0L46_03695 [Salinarimonas soli]
MADEDGAHRAYRRTIWLIALSILAFSSLQALWALSIGSAQLLKDAIDWVYDVALYIIAALVFGRGVRAEQASALVIAGVLAVAGVHTLYDLWDKVVQPRPIEPFTIGFSAVSSAIIGYLVLAALLRFRGDANPLIRATWVSARNAAISTTVFSTATYLTRTATSRWPEYGLDLFGAALLFQGAGAIVLATWRDRRAARG